MSQLQSMLEAALRRESELQQRLTTADQRIDDLETQLADREQSRRAWFDQCQSLERASPVPPQHTGTGSDYLDCVLSVGGFAEPVPPQADAQPVAIIGRDWQLLWFSPEGMETHAALCKRTGLEIGDKLYRGTHADAGEVERLRAEVKRLDLMVSQGDYNYDMDRAEFKRQLAERDALLRETVAFLVFGKLANNLPDRIVAILSASAEPGADHAD